MCIATTSSTHRPVAGRVATAAPLPAAGRHRYGLYPEPSCLPCRSVDGLPRRAGRDAFTSGPDPNLTDALAGHAQLAGDLGGWDAEPDQGNDLLVPFGLGIHQATA